MGHVVLLGLRVGSCCSRAADVLGLDIATPVPGKQIFMQFQQTANLAMAEAERLGQAAGGTYMGTYSQSNSVLLQLNIRVVFKCDTCG